MKKSGINSFKSGIKKSVAVFASREFAFLYCLLGTFGQIAHCYFLVSSISSFNGIFKVIQAVLLSLFISSSLMYFVSIADKDDPDQKEYKRIMRGVNLFMYIEIAINLYYYARHLLIDAPQLKIFDFAFSVIISVLIPITIKLYANSIKAKSWINEITELTVDDKNINNVFDDHLLKNLEARITSIESKDNDLKDLNNLKQDIIQDLSKDMDTKFNEFATDIKNDIRFKQIDIKDVDDFYHNLIETKIDQCVKDNISNNK